MDDESPEQSRSAAEDSAAASDDGELPVLGCAPNPSPEGAEAGDNELPTPATRAIIPVQVPGLARAAWEGLVHEVRHLLKERADPNTFEAHMGGATRLTPLMAATAGGRVDVVAELLVAGADPELPSASGVVAGDLAENDRAGKRISKLLAVFRTEIETQLAASGSGLAPSSPGEPSASAVLARRDAVAKVQQRGLALVEKALLGYSMLCSDAAEDDGDITLAVQGEDARKARKQRQEEKDAARQQRVAERIAARRLTVEDADEIRLRRVAEKVAARRGKDPEEEERERLKRVAEKAAARRSKQAEQEQAKERREEARLKRLAEKASDRANAREMRKEVVAQVQGDHLADTSQKPVKRKVVEADVVTCTSCGESSARLKCGRCEQMGMCAYCSKCYLCGTVSGFAAKVAKASVPGQWRV
mmetsp:Transcript_140936/g.351413  ORF Transcript_140936/g.351413 Transcript_140936/m.351413 type:complete len:419 (+) Transcript_140936:121-1377(+)